MKILTIVTSGRNHPPPDELRTLEEEDRYPRVSLYQRYVESDLLDERYMRDRVPGWRQMAYRLVPSPLDQVLEAYIVRNRYDAVVTWAEGLGLPFALLLKFTGRRFPHVTLSSWMSGRPKPLLLRLAQSHISRIVMWSSVQRAFVVDRLGIAPERIAFVKKFADQDFWRPAPGPGDTICAVGMEMRDYPTLIEALEGLDIHCHIATGRNRGKLFKTVAALEKIRMMPDNISVGRMAYPELRKLYARSRFVVIPLLPSDTDNGLTCMLEAMSMGRAVICSRTEGQVDVLREGVTGLFVPPGDPAALRSAIQHLWNNPDLAAGMGKRARELIEREHSIEQFIGSLRQVVADVSGHGNASPPFTLAPTRSPGKA